MVKRFMLAVAVVAVCSQAPAQRTESESMSFDECIKRIQKLATQVGQAPINIVETSEMRVVRFMTSDGSVLVTCSRPDRKMVVRHSPR